MRPDVVVVETSAFDLVARIGQRQEPMDVETFVAQLAVERLDEAVLDGLARSDEGELDTTLVKSLESPD